MVFTNNNLSFCLWVSNSYKIRCFKALFKRYSQVTFTSVSNYVQDGSCCNYLLFNLSSCGSAPAGFLSFGETTCCYLSSRFSGLYPVSNRDSDIHRGLKYSSHRSCLLSSGTPLHNIILQTPDFADELAVSARGFCSWRKCNRPAVHTTVSRCGGGAGDWKGPQTGFVTFWQVTRHLWNGRDKCQQVQ